MNDGGDGGREYMVIQILLLSVGAAVSLAIAFWALSKL